MKFDQCYACKKRAADVRTKVIDGQTYKLCPKCLDHIKNAQTFAQKEKK